MVKVREDSWQHADGNIEVGDWLMRLSARIKSAENAHEELATQRLRQACELSQAAQSNHADKVSQYAWNSVNAYQTGLEMADILADLHLDEETLVAAVLYRSLREGLVTLEAIERQFGPIIAQLLTGVLRMAVMSHVSGSDSDDAQLSQWSGKVGTHAENVRKMLVSLVDDVRVALIKLAERTCAIRAVKHNPSKRLAVAREVFDIYAPLAHRLGIGHIKWELEDLSFRYLDSVHYKKIADLLDAKRLDRQHFIEQVKHALEEALKSSAIPAQVTGRAKHIYSIWRKMQRKGIGFSQVYDIHAVRVLVSDIKACYAALGVVHGIWRNISNEFDDYIANPKDNGYRSLHTAVVGPEGKIVEIQIRSFAMHEEAELGVCAHWRYKGADQPGGSSYEDKMAWLRQVLEWYEDSREETDSQLDHMVAEHFYHAQDRIYVFTPKGHVISLAQGSTPLDFAYHIHTEVGHRCLGSKINGRIVPLTYRLQTGEQVEILTGKENAPRRDWLQPGLGYLKSSRYRAKVQQWFKLQARDDNIAAGKALVDKLIKRLLLPSIDEQTIAKGLGYQAIDDLYVAVGSGDVHVSHLANTLPALIDKLAGRGHFVDSERVLPKRVAKNRSSDGVVVSGVGALLTQVARCCRPVPGDPIVGYITRGRGVSIHREDCIKLLQLKRTSAERVIASSWGCAPQQQTYPVELLVEAFNRRELLRDITTLLAKAKIDLVASTTCVDKAAHTVVIRLTVEVISLDELAKLLSNIQQLANVSSVKRIEGGY